MQRSKMLQSVKCHDDDDDDDDDKRVLLSRDSICQSRAQTRLSAPASEPFFRYKHQAQGSKLVASTEGGGCLSTRGWTAKAWYRAAPA